MEKFFLSDHTIARIVQILQEGMLMGVDVTDHFRQIELVPEQDASGVNLLELSPEYAKRVIDYHIQLEKEALALQEENVFSQTKIIV